MLPDLRMGYVPWKLVQVRCYTNQKRKRYDSWANLLFGMETSMELRGRDYMGGAPMWTPCGGSEMEIKGGALTRRPRGEL